MNLFRTKSRVDATQPMGPLESAVMDILWAQGESNVRDVAQRLTRPLAYTTVMTTLDRLYKKGLLARRKEERAFFYSPSWSRQEWEQKRAGELMAAFLSGPRPAGELLISCLVEAVGEQDAALLDELERKIRSKRQELSQKEKA
jgi:predicted transcriptional regulator